MAETPREPDRYKAKARELLDAIKYNFIVLEDVARVAAALRAAESSALERAAQAVENEDEGSHGMDYQLGDVSDFRARCVKAIGALKQSHERSNDEVADVELRMPSTAVDAADVGRDAPVPSRDKAPGHPAIRALIPPAAAPAAETRLDNLAAESPGPVAETGKAETRFEKLLRVAGVRVLVEPCERGGHYLNENGVTFHPSKCAAPPEGEGK